MDFETKGHTAVMNMRVEDKESLDDFPTPPWATRALIEHVLWPSARENLKTATAWEPACGRRIMSDVLEEYFRDVIASDIASYATIYNRAPDFLGDYRTTAPPQTYHWFITNPPFNMALDFVLKALDEARQGVAILVRSNWIESQGRYEKLFSKRPPTIIAPFVERVPMIKGVWNPEASTATSYSWFVWDCEIRSDKPPRVIWIPTGAKDALTKPDDDRFAQRGRLDWLKSQHAFFDNLLEQMKATKGYNPDSKEAIKTAAYLVYLEEQIPLQENADKVYVQSLMDRASDSLYG